MLVKDDEKLQLLSKIHLGHCALFTVEDLYIVQPHLL